MELLGDDSGREGPAWVAGTLAAVGVAYAVFKFIFWLLGKRHSYSQEIERGLNEQQKAVRRDAATEAWEVVDKLNIIVGDHSSRLRELEARHAAAIEAIEEREREANDRAARCEAEHGETRGRLMVIEAWARSKGVKIPPVSGTDLQQSLPTEDQ